MCSVVGEDCLEQNFSIFIFTVSDGESEESERGSHERDSCFSEQHDSYLAALLLCVRTAPGYQRGVFGRGPMMKR